MYAESCRRCEVAGLGRKAGVSSLRRRDRTRLPTGTELRMLKSRAFAYRAALLSDYPTTGDFAACREEGGATVMRRCFRGGSSRGKQPERKATSSCSSTWTRPSSPPRLRPGFPPPERYSIVCSNDVAPIVVLNKADLAEHPQKWRTKLGRPPRSESTVSALTGLGLEELKARLEPAKTFLLLGNRAAAVDPPQRPLRFANTNRRRARRT